MNAPNIRTAHGEKNCIDWYSVRPVYRKLHTDFHILLKPFGIEVDSELNVDLAHLICAIDAVDQVVDDIDNDEQRVAFGDALVHYLLTNQWDVSSAHETPELFFRMEHLRDLTIRRGVNAEFAATVERILFHTEAKRQATNAPEMNSHLVKEWRLTGHLTVLVLGTNSTPEFEKFFYLACEMMPAVDTIQDAFSDYRKGQIQFRPNVGMYIWLIALFAIPLPKLFLLFPNRIGLMKYAISFIFGGVPDQAERVESTAVRRSLTASQS